MRRFRIVIRAATILLGVVVIAGAVVLLMAQNSALDTTFNIIAFSVSAASVAIAITSQVAAYKDRKKISQLVHSLNELDVEVEEEERDSEKIYRKLCELVAQNKELSSKLEKIEPKKSGKR